MKKYVKPMVKIVNIKSSEDIATTKFSAVKQNLIQNYLLSDGTKYAITQYSAASSAVNAVKN